MSGKRSNHEETQSRESLPPELTRIVGRVVRRTRLWPWEKRDVRAELESHFREGLIELAAAGGPRTESVAMLVESFGDPALAAKLIRRSKKRGRPMAWKIFARTMTAAVVVLSLMVAYAAYAFTRRPSPAVDYVARLSQPILATAEEDRSWPILRDVILKFAARPEKLPTGEAELPRPRQEGWEIAAAWVEANRALMPELIEAASRSVHGFVYDHDQAVAFINELASVRAGEEQTVVESTELDPLAPPVLSILLPNVSEYRDIARFLVLQARERLAASDFAAAWTSLDTAHRLGFQLIGSATLIEQLVGASVIRLANTEVREVLTSAVGLTQQEIGLVAESHLMTDAPDRIGPDFEAERLLFADVVQYAFTDDGNGSGTIIPSQYARIYWHTQHVGQPDGETAGGIRENLATLAFHADRRATVEMYDQVWNEVESLRSLPLYDARRPEAVEVESRMHDDPVLRRRFGLVQIMLPSLTTADEIIRTTAMDLRATQAVFALVRYRAERGVYPDSLDTLVPGYLAAVPVDEYSGQPLRYTVDPDGRVVLYSVGRNLVDDDGSSDLTDGFPADIVYLQISAQ